MSSKATVMLIGVVTTVFAMAAWSTIAKSYPMYDDGAGNGCVQCHDLGGQSATIHKLHTNNFADSCNLCHPSGAGSTPVSTTSSGALTDGPGLGCRGCHGRVEDDLPTGNDTWGAGLRKTPGHVSEGCSSSCHSNDPATVVGENVKPPYYSYSNDTSLSDPCDDAFTGVAGGPGLDNDGDGFTDGADSDCGIVPVKSTTWGVIKSLFESSE